MFSSCVGTIISHFETQHGCHFYLFLLSPAGVRNIFAQQKLKNIAPIMWRVDKFVGCILSSHLRVQLCIVRYVKTVSERNFYFSEKVIYLHEIFQTKARVICS
jgi:hypothetical protein